MKNLVLSIFLGAGLLFTGCASHSRSTATANIQVNYVKQIKDGVTTLTDILVMFGKPNSDNYSHTSSGNRVMGKLPDEFMRYMDCKVKTKGNLNAASFIPIVSSFAGGVNTTSTEQCSTLSVLLDKKNIVLAHLYQDDDSINYDKVKKIIKNKSSKLDVIRTLGTPDSLIPSDKEDIYIYKRCIATGTSGSLSDKQHRNCQQASFLVNKNTSIVMSVNYAPFK